MVHAPFPTEAKRSSAPGARWIPWIFVGGMLGVVAVNAVLIFFAFSSWSGTVSSRPYERGIDYNRVLTAAARESALGWTAEAHHQPDGDGRGALSIALRDARNAPLAGEISVVAERPLEPIPPLSLAVRYVGEGRYVASLAELPKQGLWSFRIEVARSGDIAHFTRRVVVP